MSQAGSQAWAFYGEVAKTGVLWTLRDDKGFPAPITPAGKRAMPFWSSRSRVERIIAKVPVYDGFRPYEISWDDFQKKWLPGLERDGMMAGVNWSGLRAVGFDIEPRRLQQSILNMIQNPQ